VPHRKHRKRRKKDEIEILAGRLFKYGPLAGSKKDFVCYLPPGQRGGTSELLLSGPGNEWDSDRDKCRDTRLCNLLSTRTGFTVGACFYEVYGLGSLDKDGVRKPRNWIGDLYKYAKRMKYERLHLVGYSGGAMLASSQLVFHPPPSDCATVKTLVLIAAYTADGLDKAHRNAAFFADRVKAKTRLIWGTGDDAARLGAEEWKKRNAAADSQPYTGGHNFYDDGQFDKVSEMAITWIG
jgi:pimeloyl-ACP methyl ester carboxylesterase